MLHTLIIAGNRHIENKEDNAGGKAWKFRFISELDIKLGVADWNKCFTATPSALKQQAFTGIYVLGYK